MVFQYSNYLIFLNIFNVFMMNATEKWKSLLRQVVGVVSDCFSKRASINRPSFQLKEESNDVVSSCVALISCFSHPGFVVF